MTKKGTKTLLVTFTGKVLKDALASVHGFRSQDVEMVYMEFPGQGASGAQLVLGDADLCQVIFKPQHRRAKTPVPSMDNL